MCNISQFQGLIIQTWALILIRKLIRCYLKKYLQVNKVLETGMPDEYLKNKIQCILKNHQEDENCSLSIFKIHISPSEQCPRCIVYPSCTDWAFSMRESCYLCLRLEEIMSHFSRKSYLEGRYRPTHPSSHIEEFTKHSTVMF